MPTTPAVTFDHDATVAAYDEFQVPALFRPWAAALALAVDDWRGRRVLDLATGSGIVAEVLAPRVGPDGLIIGVDPSGGMLELARRRCGGLAAPVRLVRSAAHPLRLPDASVDVVVCQQGFQFFPDRAAAAAEMLRVLSPGGRVLLTTWTSLAECDWFRAVRDALAVVGQDEAAARLEVPFDLLPAGELRDHFVRAGFVAVEVGRRQRALTFGGGMAEAIDAAWSTVAGPDLAALPAAEQAAFRDALAGELRKLTCDGCTMGRTTVNLLTAAKGR